MNYGSLIAWAETCHIPIQQKAKEEMDPEQIEQISQKVTVIVMGILILFTALFPFLYYIFH